MNSYDVHIGSCVRYFGEKCDYRLLPEGDYALGINCTIIILCVGGQCELSYVIPNTQAAHRAWDGHVFCVQKDLWRAFTYFHIVF